MMLYGRYEHTVDAKGRMFVPAKLREKLGESFIAAAVIDNCICLYSLDEWERLMEKLMEKPMTEARSLQRYIASNAVDVQVDAQGRILLPRHLIGHAGLVKEALVIGAVNHAEIWNPADYESSVGSMTSEAAENVFIKLGF